MPTVYNSFNDWLAHQDTEALNCRVKRHIWPSYDDKRVHYYKSRHTGRITIEEPCLRECGTIRTSHLGENGALEERSPHSYDHPDGYQYKTREKTAGPHVTREYNAAIRAALVAGVPAGRFEVVDDL